MQKYKTTILQFGNNTGIEVPPEVVEALGAGKKPPVVVTANGYTYRNSIAVMNGKFLISLSAAHRAASGLAGGDTIEVGLELDTAPRTVEVPADFRKALDKYPAARKKFEGLSNSRKKQLVLPVEDAKTEETRARRIEKAVRLLLDDQG